MVYALLGGGGGDGCLHKSATWTCLSRRQIALVCTTAMPCGAFVTCLSSRRPAARHGAPAVPSIKGELPALRELPTCACARLSLSIIAMHSLVRSTGTGASTLLASCSRRYTSVPADSWEFTPGTVGGPRGRRGRGGAQGGHAPMACPRGREGRTCAHDARSDAAASHIVACPCCYLEGAGAGSA
jgi:hypothetical protein